MLDKLNLTRDTNLAKLKQELKFSANESSHVVTASRSQLSRLQELEEVTVEQDNTISALHQKIKKLNTELETWKARYMALGNLFNVVQKFCLIGAILILFSVKFFY